VARRVAILFALGLVLNSFPYWSPSTLRIPGVLQRIAPCYAAAVPLVLRTRPRTQAWAAAALLLVYAGLLLFVPVPGHGAGAIDSKEGNLAAFVDRALLAGHLYRGSWDPEGVLSTLPAIATTLLGVLAGHWLRSPRDARAKSAALLAAGAIAIAAGQLWGRWLPINKSLWTPSYVLFTGGISLAILAACHFAIDVRGHRAVARVLAVLGANAIVCYVGSELLEQLLETTPIRLADGTYTAPKLWLWTHFFSLWPSAPAASLAYALLQVALWLAVAAELQRRRIFVRI
jgi:predicted acyltransferase